MGRCSAPEFLLTSVDTINSQPTSETVRWQLIEEEWDYFWTRSDNGWDYRVEILRAGCAR